MLALCSCSAMPLPRAVALAVAARAWGAAELDLHEAALAPGTLAVRRRSAPLFRGCCRPISSGLDLYLDVAPPLLQARLVLFVAEALRAGRAGELHGKSYMPVPSRWVARGKSREMLQYGVFTNANRVSDADVLPLPPLLVEVCDLLESFGIVSGPAQRPDTCAVNVYAEGSWLPPHVDSAKFARPFCTLSLLSSQRVAFGDSICGDDGSWRGAETRTLMPIGSVLRVAGAAAGPRCAHALSSASAPRISFTFRRLAPEARVAIEQSRAERAARSAAKHARLRAEKLERRAAKAAKRAAAKAALSVGSKLG